MAPSAKLSVLSEITKAPRRVVEAVLRDSMLFNTTSRGVTPVFKFVGFAASGSSSASTVGAVDVIALTDGTITDLVFQLTAPPGLGNSVTLELMVNGVASGLIATISGAVATTGIVTGGLVAIAADDLLACQVGFTGIAAATIRSIGAVVNARASWNPASGNGLVGSASTDSVPIQAVTVTRVGFKDTNVTGAPTSIDISVGGSLVDSVAISAGINNFSADVSVPVAAGTTEALAIANTGDLSGPGRMTTAYLNNDEELTLCLLAHDALYQWSLSNEQQFSDWDGSIPVSTEAGKQGAWPLAGTITAAALLVDQFTSTSGGLDDVNITYVFRINGVDTVITGTFQKLSATRYILLTGLSVHLAQGDLVSRAATPDNTNALNFKIRMLCAFVPD